MPNLNELLANAIMQEASIGTPSPLRFEATAVLSAILDKTQGAYGPDGAQGIVNQGPSAVFAAITGSEVEKIMAPGSKLALAIIDEITKALLIRSQADMLAHR